jgi:hypothetical protein
VNLTNCDKFFNALLRAFSPFNQGFHRIARFETAWRTNTLY